jgi:hypothetical protein
MVQSYKNLVTKDEVEIIKKSGSLNHFTLMKNLQKNQLETKEILSFS